MLLSMSLIMYTGTTHINFAEVSLPLKCSFLPTILYLQQIHSFRTNCISSFIHSTRISWRPTINQARKEQNIKVLVLMEVIGIHFLRISVRIHLFLFYSIYCLNLHYQTYQKLQAIMLHEMWPTVVLITL